MSSTGIQLVGVYCSWHECPKEILLLRQPTGLIYCSRKCFEKEPMIVQYLFKKIGGNTDE